ncbi:serine hydroxymethyltransferase [Nocardioides sp. NPDC000445]|uniref:serine hydroxymethyltransferase n=1 Tax=Nocardioides sp. NPDC000445 TaxID=3154257 RepID=UPI0033313CE3
MPNVLSPVGVRQTDLARDEPLAGLLDAEVRRARSAVPLVASASIGHPEMRALAGSEFGDLTTEGYPGARFHPGCEVFDRVEELAQARACSAFGASFANVQAHSGSTANQAATAALASPGSRVLSMDLKAGGHLSHGARASQTSRWFEYVHYDVDGDGFLNYDQIRAQAREVKPALIICGASSYPRQIDFAAFSDIAREVGAALIADISHISGLVVAGQHPSPIPHADLVTTSTYKQLAGPRGGLILGGTNVPDAQALHRRVDQAVFPGLQGTPNGAAVAAKAWALGYVASPEFRAIAARIVDLARIVADRLANHGHRIVTRGTDTHMVLVDTSAAGLYGLESERALEEAGILVNRNAIPHDPRPPSRPSGIRLGLNSLAQLGASDAEATLVADMVAAVLAALRQAETDQLRDTIETTRIETATLMEELWTTYSEATATRGVSA